jgi:hypothetical protein
MTLTRAQPPGVGQPMPRRARWRRLSASPTALAAAFAAVALGVRSIGLTHGFEVWVDEMLYADLGASAGRGEMPRLADGTFFLHPPGFFLLEGGVIRLFHISTSDSMSLVYDLRWLTSVLGALTVGLVFLLARRVAGTWPATFAALALAFEPFVLRINSRVILESLAALMLVAGLLVVVGHIQQRPEAGQRTGVRYPSSSTVRLLAGGLLLGYSVFTKDAFAFFAVLPVVLAVVWRRTLTRREGVVIAAAAAVPYGVYLIVVSATGYLGEWERAKVSGFLRLVGKDVFTGFNAPGSPSLLGRLVAQAEHYGTSYVILLLCPLAGLVACCSARPERRLLGLVALSTGAYGVYMVAFGTAEEQYAYPILIAGVTALAVVTRMVLDRRPRVRTATVSLLAVFLLAEIALGARQELTRDDGLLTFRMWAARHLPADVSVGATNDASAYAFRHDPRFGPWSTAHLLDLHRAQYVLTFDLPTRQGYTQATPGLLNWLDSHASPVFSTYGPTNGETVLWYIDPHELALAAAHGVGERPGVPGGTNAASGSGG